MPEIPGGCLFGGTLPPHGNSWVTLAISRGRSETVDFFFILESGAQMLESFVI